MKYQFDLGNGRKPIFTRKGKEAYWMHKDSGEYLVNADIRAADGTMYDALIVIDTWSSGEH